jgi:uncharacterized membrane protein YccC
MYDFRPRDPNLRASDADREEMAERLRRHHTDGRLDAEEFQQRIDACYSAKTIGELRELLKDLPRDEQDYPSWPGVRPLRPWRWAPVPFLPILIAVLIVSAITAHHHFFGLWILIPAFFLAKMWFWRRASWFSSWRRYGPGPRL